MTHGDGAATASTSDIVVVAPYGARTPGFREPVRGVNRVSRTKGRFGHGVAKSPTPSWFSRSYLGWAPMKLNHDFMWRSLQAMPERGGIGIFNRSYYEEVLVVRVHPELLDLQKLPPEAKGKGIWKHRFDEINAFEKYLVNRPEKTWKFSLTDAKERAHWDDYMNAFEDTFNHTSTEWAPWHVIPAGNKWFTRTVVADVIVEKLKSLNLSYPAAKSTGSICSRQKSCWKTNGTRANSS